MKSAPQRPERVLVVEDEPDLRDLVVFNLRDAGFQADGAGSGAQALALAARIRPSVVILDLMLPDMSGTEVCRALRTGGREDASGPSVLMLTARGDEASRLEGFEVGADDYVVKPFSVRELVMRVRALVRRAPDSARAKSGGVLRSGDLVVDVVRHRVQKDGQELSLRPLEFKLLALLLSQPGKVWSRREILEQVWGAEEQSSRIIDTHVTRLREKLGSYGEALETVHGTGYRFREA